jgi:ElaB/YqjD/DUF883 family membrane-anchored ribosome-binding protein
MSKCLKQPDNMSNPFSTNDNFDPAAGFTREQGPSISQAAHDLRVAAEGKAKEILHTAEHKAAEIKEKAVGTAQQFRETATERASAFKSTATDKAQQFRDTASCQWDDTRVRARELHVTAEDYIRQNPTQCILGAVGLGFLIGLIVRR